jgi:hypothetical protein
MKTYSVENILATWTGRRPRKTTDLLLQNMLATWNGRRLKKTTDLLRTAQGVVPQFDPRTRTDGPILLHVLYGPRTDYCAESIRESPHHVDNSLGM